MGCCLQKGVLGGLLEVGSDSLDGLVLLKVFHGLVALKEAMRLIC